MATTHSKALGRRKQNAHITRKDIDQGVQRSQEASRARYAEFRGLFSDIPQTCVLYS